MTSRNDVIPGTRSEASLSTLVEPIVDFSDQLVRKTREVARATDDYVHDNPWAAVGVVGLIGLTAGYLLSRRF